MYTRFREKAAGLGALICTLLLAGCGNPPWAEDMNASYQDALVRTAPAAVELPGGEAGARQALAGFETLFTDLASERVRAKAATVYAPDAYLNDNITALEGGEAIGAYLAATAGRMQSLRVEFLGIAHTGPDYLARWRMTVTAAKLNGGQPIVSYGVSHLRFDAGGRILLHKDFWDAGTGLYEYVPGLRGLVRSVRAMAGES